MKTIAMKYGTHTYHADITSTMTENGIYDTLRAALKSAIGNYHIVVWDSKRQQIAHLQYNKLKAGRPYTIELSPLRTQGASADSWSKSRRRVRIHIKDALEHWKLEHATDIYPAEIAPRAPNADNTLPHLSDPYAPREDPSFWSAKLAEQMGRLSVRSRERHAEAMAIVKGQVDARYAAQGADAVLGVTTTDVHKGVAAWTEKLKREEASEIVEGDETNDFVGGLGAALEDAEREEEGGIVGTAYEKDGKFVIARRWKKE